MKNAGKSVILIVDDKPANILVLENLLAAEDRILLNATDGNSALKIALNNEVDLVMLDVQMPGMDGFEVVQIMKSNKRTRNIPIVFVTAESKERKQIMKGYGEGAIDYLFKPLDPEIVKAKVTVLLRIQSQQKELVEKNLSLQKSALLINNSADIIGIIDEATLKIEEVNNAFTDLLGYSAEEVKDMPLSFFLADEDKPVLNNRDLQGRERLSFETRVYGKDRRMKWLQWKVVVKDDKWFVNARDITEVKQADEQIRLLNEDLRKNVLQLEASNKELESFSYSVSHDLRAPLRAINGYSSIIESEYMSQMDEEMKRLLTNIQANAIRMGILINDLLEFSRLGRKELQKSKVDMGRMIANVLDEINKSTPHQAKINVHSLPPADADHTLLQQVCINLISNAIKYSAKKEQPEIEIGAISADSENTYFVKDNGSGFDMKYADKLFGVFQRLHKQSDFEGTGVGLAIVYRIITKHGGRVWADARVNEGATFYFTIPKVFDKTAASVIT